MRKIILGRKFTLAIVDATCIVRFLLGLIIISLKVTGTLIDTLGFFSIRFPWLSYGLIDDEFWETRSREAR